MVLWVPTEPGCQVGLSEPLPPISSSEMDDLGTHGEQNFLVWKWNWIFIALSYYNLLSIRKKLQAKRAEWGEI